MSGGGEPRPLADPWHQLGADLLASILADRRVGDIAFSEINVEHFAAPQRPVALAVRDLLNTVRAVTLGEIHNAALRQGAAPNQTAALLADLVDRAIKLNVSPPALAPPLLFDFRMEAEEAIAALRFSEPGCACGRERS